MRCYSVFMASLAWFSISQAAVAKPPSQCPGGCATLSAVADNVCQKGDRTYSAETPPTGSYMPWSAIPRSMSSVPGKQYVTIVNLTPHRFKLLRTHSYQMDRFDFGDIPQGRARQNTVAYTSKIGANPVDDGGEAYYSIEGTDKKFVIRATTRIPDRYAARTVIDLTGMGMGQREYLDPAKEAPVTLVITGSNDYGFITSLRHGPGNWMKGLYPTIKDREMQHVIIPGTHDSGMSKISGKLVSGGISENTQTQGINIYDQLRAGARWFDLRVGTVHNVPNNDDRSFWIMHVNDERAEISLGNTGESLDEVISEINRFTAEFPGEAIFFRVRYLIGIRKIPSLGPIYWNKRIVDDFFGKLRGVNNRCGNLATDVKFNKRKASYFMDQNGGNGCAIFLLAGNIKPDLPQDSIADGIYKTNQMDINDNWSNLPETEPMSKDQVADWKGVGRSAGFANDAFHISQWIVSSDVLTTTRYSIQGLATLPTNPALYWMGVNNMSPESWPTVLLVDYIGTVVMDRNKWDELSADLYTLVVGLNLYMVSENCDVSKQRSPLLPGGQKKMKTSSLVQPWYGIIYANGTVVNNPPPTLHPGRVEILKSGTKFLNGTMLRQDVVNPDFKSTKV